MNAAKKCVVKQRIPVVFAIILALLGQAVPAILWPRDIRVARAYMRSSSTGIQWRQRSGRWSDIVFAKLEPEFQTNYVIPSNNVFASLDYYSPTLHSTGRLTLSYSDWAATTALADELSKPNKALPLLVGTVWTGWPIRCLSFDFRDVIEFNTTSFNGAMDFLLPPPGGGPSQGLIVPGRVHWWRFFGSSSIFCVVISICWWFREVVRLRWRRCRNRCPSCGYSLAGLMHGIVKCPECGDPFSAGCKNSVVGARTSIVSPESAATPPSDSDDEGLRPSAPR